MTYDVGMVSRLTGVPRNTLIAWERRYGVVRPQRAANGYRMYTPAEVETLRRLKELVDHGHRVGQAAQVLRAD